MGMIKVACRVPNGLLIKRFKDGPDDGTGSGIHMRALNGAAVRLNGPSSRNAGAHATQPLFDAPGITDVDEDWIKGWLDENRTTALVTSGAVYLLEKEDIANPS